MPVPASPKIYHIVHINRLASIISEDCLWCDAEAVRRRLPGATIGMNSIKQRRLRELTLASHPGLFVGSCVPFYFCPRSIMLFVIHKANDAELSFRDGQSEIVHLEADLRQAAAWADENQKRWAFTLSNAGSRYFEDRSDLAHLREIDWDAVQNNQWGYPGVPQSVREGKQAEFMVECSFPWRLVSRIGVISQRAYSQVHAALQASDHKPRIDILRSWYY